ncbi:MAG: UDP-N-acetylmuramoyl-tripeptide--D-alanyl-D-alanine ligase [Eubacteriales bacterium]|nr:UDP-N-acetylmuramoyl-tripeptide--D-alanyl-D-alanine ligase [Eubacteriales bacterium]
MKYFTVSDIAKITGGTLTGEGNAEVGAIVVDSRNVKKGDLFAAFKGEKSDGHDYIPTAFEKGASCCLAERIPEGVRGSVIVVDNVQSAIEKIGKACREKLNIPVIGVTGSVGKTTAKEMVWAVLSQRFNTLKTEGNHNNQIGVPMTLSRIEREHEAAVVELGISGFGEMRLLSSMARPTAALFTYIGHAHLEFLHDLDGVFAAKTEMLENMDEDALTVINGDDEKLRQLAYRKNLISFGLNENNDVRAENIKACTDGTTECTILYGERKIDVKIPAYGQHMVYAALEGAAVGFAMGLSGEEIKNGIESYQTVGRRGAVTDTGFITVIDDCYNANPDSMKCAVDSLMRMSGRHVCVVSDMRELGENSEEMHRQVGKYMAEKGVELVLSCGPMSRFLCEESGERAVWFEEKQTLIDSLEKYTEKGDCVLVKASLGMHLENAAEALKMMKK